MKKFRTNYSDKIEVIDIIKETDKQVIYHNGHREVREAKVSEYHSWHNDFEQAKQYVLNYQNERLERYEKYVEICKEKIAKIEVLNCG